MNLRPTLAILVWVLTPLLGSSAFAQTEVDQVKAANQAIMAAGLRGDQNTFARLVADELQWIRATGEVLGKAEYTKTINPGIAASQRTFTDEAVAIYGDVALLICRSDFISPQGQKRAERVLRAFVRRNGQWLLLRHAATPLMAP
jgi:ketosteroid isomerase-like protein